VIRRRPRSDVQVLLLALAAGLPGTAAALYAVWWTPAGGVLRWTATLLLPLVWIGCAEAARRHFARPVQTLANLLAALRVGDFSSLAAGGRPDDPMGLAVLELNQLAAALRHRRLAGLETEALLRAVLAEVAVVIVALDDADRIQFANRAAETLLGRPSRELMGASAADAGLADLLRRDSPTTVEHAFPGGTGRWDLRIGTFRQEGVPHRLLVLSDVGRALRQEERDAWRRLIRVLSHEINNSLTPIQSISSGLLDLMRRDARPADLDDDLAQGLAVIAGRAAALGRFMTSYARLARLPAPRLRPVEIGTLVERVVRLETRGRVSVHVGPPRTVQADPDQIEQALINLLANAVEAAEETGGGVEVGWTERGAEIAVWVRDEGPGIGSTGNLFVPFFTTKPRGSGIGLVLSRQIAEAHGGSVELENRTDRAGSEARLLLPLG
jgi:two-component system, NtrC family, nitrogen regulation sensor histidine kinase NtrY